ncbi:Zn-dependent Protease domain protein [Halomicronema hongdechloris C2206]|uniref:Zn-dependent Protease domain protein n=1 Tax=Halomicronema hongdechloris C2206 TaxID=1641165 RepID=A0A1Z3HVL4_9CYAN|nr:M48 family metalloprotease [Halomicronema hongdechloris]ASC74333.1 Zn-dependent Protease domain protein [Halomicronema hongdechloris C2206]
MSQSPSSTPTPGADPTAIQLFNRGIAALQRQEYTVAIATFTQLQAQFPTLTSYQLKAQMGLVKAYAAQGQHQDAIALCQRLRQSRHPKVQAWAKRVLPQLLADAGTRSGARQSNPSGFTPLSPQASAQQSTSTTQATDLSGFTPLSANADIKQPGEGHREPGTADGSDTPPRESAPETMATSQENPAEIPPDSLFHYQRLNQSSPSTPATPPTAETSAAAPASRFPQPVRRLSPQAQAGALNAVIWQLGLIQVATAVVCFWLLRWLVQGSLHSINWGIVKLSIRWPIYVAPIQAFYQDHSLSIAVIIGALILTSPWAIDGMLRWRWGLRSLPPRELRTYSPKALQLIQRVCQQRGWLRPELRLLPTDMPISFSYGWWPRYTRIVVSQGLLTQLSEEDLTALYAYEVSHVCHWDLPIISGLSLLLLLLHQGYWSLALWGNRRGSSSLRYLAACGAAAAYGLYWLLRKVGLPLSQLRSRRCDRTALTLTQDPDSHQRLLLYLAETSTTAIEQQGYLPPLMESLDLLMPISPAMILHLGSSARLHPWADLLTWDCQSPYRHWLSLNQPQPLLGERIQTMQQWAQYHGIAYDATLPSPKSAQAGQSPTAWSQLLWQGSPIVGMITGLGIAMGLWFIGGLVTPLGWPWLSWLYQDSSLIKAGLLLGLGIGILLRINRTFPDIIPSQALHSPALPSLLQSPSCLPLDSQPIYWQGTVLGAPGIASWLGQNLLFKTQTGLMHLHVLSTLGPIGNLLIPQTRPGDFVGHTLTISGWFRRGATARIDLDTVQANRKRQHISNPPLWSTLLSLVFCSWGLLILYTGQ